MDTVVVALRNEDDDCIEFEAVVDTLDPIRAVIDGDDEPDAPDFTGCTLLDTSYGSDGGKNAFVIEYDLDDDTPLPGSTVETTLRDFLKLRYGIHLLGFGPLAREEATPQPGHPSPGCRGPVGR